MTDLLRFVHWNIKEGGSDRISEILDVLERLEPDVVSLAEIRPQGPYNCGERRSEFDPYPTSADWEYLRPHAARLGLEIAGITPSVAGVPAALLYRYASMGGASWHDRHNAYLVPGAFGIAEFTPPGWEGPLAVATVHINPWSGQMILVQHQAVAARLREVYRQRMVAIGDWNSLPDYGPAGDVARMRPHHRMNHLVDADLRRWPPTPNLAPARALRGAGLLDVAELAGACEPVPGESDRAWSDRCRTGRFARIDRGYVDASLAAGVAGYGRFAGRSDHFGIWFDLDPSGAADQDPMDAFYHRDAPGAIMTATGSPRATSTRPAASS